MPLLDAPTGEAFGWRWRRRFRRKSRGVAVVVVAVALMWVTAALLAVTVGRYLA